MAHSKNEKLSYIALHQSGELERRIKTLVKILKRCTLCPRRCQVNRIDGNVGYCGAGKALKVSSAFSHFGEERPLVGRKGSGTIFLTHCNLRCSFCQNYDISHQGVGDDMTSEQLAHVMVFLQEQGCHNINFVTPTHYVPQIISALPAAIDLGLNLPIVYNCGGYESLEVIQLLEGIVDIYMPDAKFSNDEMAGRYADAPDYFSILKSVLKEMHRQVGALKIAEDGVACRGVIIRHLVMPNDVAGSERIIKFIANHISRDSYVNIMNQYRPCFQANHDSLINRTIRADEYHNVIEMAKQYGLHRGF